MNINERKITVEYVRRKYEGKYQNLTDEEIQKKIDTYYFIAELLISDLQDNLLMKKLNNQADKNNG